MYINRAVVSGIQVAFILYFIFQIGTVKQGKLKNGVMGILLGVSLFMSYMVGVGWIGNLLSTGYMILFALFYDDESFWKQWKWMMGFGVSLGVWMSMEGWLGFSISISAIGLCLISYLWLAAYRKVLKIEVNIGVLVIYGLLLYLIFTNQSQTSRGVLLVIGVVIFFVFEQMLRGYNKNFQRKTTQFQQELLLNQYEEVKSIYLNMRGFRHDYHNHIQVIKAHLYRERIDLIEKYLLEIEKELERIDTSVRSGNMMVDAILNSKVTLAEKQGIHVVCKAKVPERLPITDIDLCVILGNLLDNAIESCQKIEEGRFIRIYMTVIKEQLYVSIQNAAKEALDFNERAYITTKRGNHGLGMKRVKLLVDKYEGYLNLQNEPGIFACEATMPLNPCAH